MFYFFYKFIIILLATINVLLIFKNKKIQTFNNNYNSKNNNCTLMPLMPKSKSYNIYKDFLKLYIENKEMFYKKGREYYLNQRGEIYNESNLITFQDKLNYLLIHESPENKTNIVDKILLRNYSINILGKDICPPILKIYNNVDEINLDELPDKFLLKCNHGSGMNIFCRNKTKFDLENAKKTIINWMNINYGLQNFEYQYLNIEKKIFAEKFLVDEIINYKFYCFNGEPKLVRVKGKFQGSNIYNIYHINWTLANIEFAFSDYKRDETNKFKKSINYELMINYSRLLTSNFCFCRVDFYEIDERVYLSELTFTPFNMYIKYKSKEMEIYLGSLLNISKIKNRNYQK